MRPRAPIHAVLDQMEKAEKDFLQHFVEQTERRMKQRDWFSLYGSCDDELMTFSSSAKDSRTMKDRIEYFRCRRNAWWMSCFLKRYGIAAERDDSKLGH